MTHFHRLQKISEREKQRMNIVYTQFASRAQTFLQRFLAETECLATSALLSCMLSLALLMDWLRNKDSCSCGGIKQNMDVLTDSAIKLTRL